MPDKMLYMWCILLCIFFVCNSFPMNRSRMQISDNEVQNKLLAAIDAEIKALETGTPGNSNDIQSESFDNGGSVSMADKMNSAAPPSGGKTGVSAPFDVVTETPTPFVGSIMTVDTYTTGSTSPTSVKNDIKKSSKSEYQKVQVDIRINNNIDRQPRNTQKPSRPKPKSVSCKALCRIWRAPCCDSIDAWG